MKQNYAEYHFSKTEILKYLIQSILLCGAMDYLFYQNWWLMLLTVPVTVLFMRLKKKGLIRERKRKLNYQFKDALNALSVAVQAGYSVENAVAACSRDLERLYPKETDIVKEFHYIETQLRVSVPVEELLLSLGDRSGIEDVENFAAVFYTAKRTGGDMNRIIQTSARMLGDKIAGGKESRTDDHESDAGRNHSLPETDLSGILKRTVWESFWNVCDDTLSGDLCVILLAWAQNC